MKMHGKTNPIITMADFGEWLFLSGMTVQNPTIGSKLNRPHVSDRIGTNMLKAPTHIAMIMKITFLVWYNLKVKNTFGYFLIFIKYLFYENEH